MEKERKIILAELSIRDNDKDSERRRMMMMISDNDRNTRCLVRRALGLFLAHTPLLHHVISSLNRHDRDCIS